MTLTLSMIRKLMKTHSYLPNHIIQKHANRIAEVVENETDCQEQYEYYRFPIYIGYSDQFILDAYLNIDKIKDFLTSNKQKPKKFLLEEFTFGTRHQESH
ncbi:hypothetical protein [Enterococcus wangshanyuanii]|uniref:hypothetical protein n=1 Tax=Enterococcus wangshanyuanii TaxID=2005703 RepID=UPI000B4AE718|nr:hypothetical protein [Enterococcus wangshanyuanii]